MAFKMKGSPYKNYANPQEYKVFNWGNKPTPIKKGHTLSDTSEHVLPGMPETVYTEEGEKISTSSANFGEDNFGKKKTDGQGRVYIENIKTKEKYYIKNPT